MRGPQKKNVQSKRESVGNDCKASIRIRKVIGQDQVEVEYQWQHNHSKDGAEVTKYPLGSNELEWTKRQIEEGHSWSGIKKKLRPNEQQMDEFEQGEREPPGFFIKYNDLRHALYRNRIKDSQKKKNVTESVTCWINVIKDKGGKGIFFDDLSIDGKKHFLIAWSTKFQLDIMASNTAIACMDSTYKAVKNLWPSETDNTFCNAETEEDLIKFWDLFKTTFPDATTLTNYIDKNWITETRRARWVKYVRQDYQQVDTNNMIEGDVNQDFRVLYFKITKGLLPIILTAADKTRKKEAMDLPFDQALRLMTDKTDESKFTVKSFSGSGIEYTIMADIPDSLLISCSCPDNVNNKILCKHLYLVARVTDIFEIRYIQIIRDNQRNTAYNNDDSGDDILDDPPVPDFIPNKVRALIFTRRAQDREEKKKKREEGIAQAFRQGNERLKELWIKMGPVITNNDNRKCTLDYMQGAVATLEKAWLELKGVNEFALDIGPNPADSTMNSETHSQPAKRQKINDDKVIGMLQMATYFTSKGPFSDAWNAAKSFYTHFEFKNHSTAAFNLRKVLENLEASGVLDYRYILQECNKTAFREKERILFQEKKRQQEQSFSNPLNRAAKRTGQRGLAYGEKILDFSMEKIAEFVTNNQKSPAVDVPQQPVQKKEGRKREVEENNEEEEDEGDENEGGEGSVYDSNEEEDLAELAEEGERDIEPAFHPLLRALYHAVRGEHFLTPPLKLNLSPPMAYLYDYVRGKLSTINQLSKVQQKDVFVAASCVLDLDVHLDYPDRTELLADCKDLKFDQASPCLQQQLQNYQKYVDVEDGICEARLIELKTQLEKDLGHLADNTEEKIIVEILLVITKLSLPDQFGRPKDTEQSTLFIWYSIWEIMFAGTPVSVQVGETILKEAKKDQLAVRSIVGASAAIGAAGASGRKLDFRLVAAVMKSRNISYFTLCNNEHKAPNTSDQEVDVQRRKNVRLNKSIFAYNRTSTQITKPIIFLDVVGYRARVFVLQEHQDIIVSCEALKRPLVLATNSFEMGNFLDGSDLRVLLAYRKHILSVARKIQGVFSRPAPTTPPYTPQLPPTFYTPKSPRTLPKDL
ncbi:hypothetical protein BGZ46_001844, partial [Entomortierella lignicola]